uniref:Uncharacterized protein n=1 Tax=Meloidogyne enterolobii TaxID=390850 RepID=A0A6V7U1L0_MELEN|nr:unnamed protein product [Meloidogyne enterolobii]
MEMPVEWMLGSRSYNNFNYAAINPIAFNDLWISIYFLIALIWLFINTTNPL